LPDAPEAQIAVTEKGLPLAILKDQIPIRTSPVRIRMHDLIWLLPLGAATGVTLATDTDAMRGVSRDRSFNKDNVNASNYLLGSEIAVPVGLYGVGLFKGDAHARETSILSGEALADSVVVEEVTKIIFRRERPLYNNAAGDFFCAEHRYERLVSLFTQHAGVDVGRSSAGRVSVEVGTSGRVLCRLRREPDARSRPRTFPDRCPGWRHRGMANRALRFRSPALAEPVRPAKRSPEARIRAIAGAAENSEANA
jgi:hypothetical protein